MNKGAAETFCTRRLNDLDAIKVEFMWEGICIWVLLWGLKALLRRARSLFEFFSNTMPLMKTSAERQTVPFLLAVVCEICWIKKVKCHSIARNYRQIVDARSSANKFSLKSHAAAASVKQLMRAVIAQWSSKSVFLYFHLLSAKSYVR
jgi:hypothetical protein